MSDSIRPAYHGVTDTQPPPLLPGDHADTPVLEKKPARRPLIPLLLVVLGVGLYFVGWTITYAPKLMPIMLAINATMFGPMACVLLLAIWYLAFGRGVGFLARLGITALAIACGVGLVFAAQTDTRFWLVIWGIPAAVGVLTVAALVLFHARAAVRVPAVLLLTAAAVAPWEMIRMEGVTGEFGLNPAWRWTPTAEQRVADFVAQEKMGAAPAAAVAVLQEGDWPGFRGPDRQGRVTAPVSRELVEVWRRPVGPGWGSVSGVGDRIFTQEQRGANEVVACYELKTGKPLWIHTDEARHADGPSGPGPRATPTFHAGKLYVQGATGLLSRLDASTGKPDWSVNLCEVLDVKAPPFGFSGSPLVRDGKVYVCPGTRGPLLIALAAASGKKLWASGEQDGQSYGSPQPATVAGVAQVLVYAADGLFAYDPERGEELWRYELKSDPTAQACIQPLLLPGDRIVLGSAQAGSGMRCVQVTHQGGKWSVTQLWESTKATPRFNDMVLREGRIYGLDSGRVFCVDAETGDQVWKGRSAAFASGQVLLVGDRLLVQAERGFLSWLDADPQSPPKPERVEAMNDKTWNHPAVVRGWLVVRNGKEMVGFGPKE